MLLQPYIGQMTFVHKAGKRHLNVDALSRLERQTSKETDTGSAIEKEGLRRRLGRPAPRQGELELKGEG
jgi:hypothetical protein